MTGQERIQAELMIYAIGRDYFGYGSTITKLSNGKYKAIVDCERYDYTLKQLAAEWPTIDKDTQEEICKDYFSHKLINGEAPQNEIE